MTLDAWQPIETAPRNGEWILVYEEDQYAPSHQVARWLEEHPYKHRGVTVRPEGWYSDGFDRDRPCGPTHWMPLPMPPSRIR